MLVKRCLPINITWFFDIFSCLQDPLSIEGLPGVKLLNLISSPAFWWHQFRILFQTRILGPTFLLGETVAHIASPDSLPLRVWKSFIKFTFVSTVFRDFNNIFKVLLEVSIKLWWFHLTLYTIGPYLFTQSINTYLFFFAFFFCLSFLTIFQIYNHNYIVKNVSFAKNEKKKKNQNKILNDIKWYWKHNIGIIIDEQSFWLVVRTRNRDRKARNEISCCKHWKIPFANVKRRMLHRLFAPFDSSNQIDVKET